MFHKKNPKYKAAIRAAKAIKKTRTPLEKRVAISRWCDAARGMLG
jgi:hypothetical protein